MKKHHLLSSDSQLIAFVDFIIGRCAEIWKFGITIDSQTLEDQTVTIRERDSMQQTRVALDKVAAFMNEKMEVFVRE